MSKKETTNNCNEKANNKKKNYVKRSLKYFFLFLIVLLLFAGTGALTVVYSFFGDVPDINTWELQTSLSSTIYDRYGEEITTIYGQENRIYVSIDDIPQHVQEAFIAIEDERFYRHSGVDLLAIARSFFHNFRERNWVAQGGSTITQQLVKNTMLTQEKTYARKIQEIWLSLQMERRFSKEEILEMYLNQIYFAHGAYGLEAASQIYFDKPVSKLTVGEAALLAGIPRSPNNLSPYINLDASLQRQDVILHKMAELEYITREEADAAKQQDIFLRGLSAREFPYPYFINYVLHHELLEILTSLPQFSHRSEAYDAIYSKGIKVYTTMDQKAQSAVDAIINDESLYNENITVDMALLRELNRQEDLNHYPPEVIVENGIPQPQAAAVVADPNTGEVKALVGGRNYSHENQYLRYLHPRQPGSAIKPIAVYAPAIEEKLIGPGTAIDDAPTLWSSYAPENFGGTFPGLVTVREALARSLNVSAVKMFSRLTPSVGLDYAEKMGISTIHENDYLAAALGGLTLGTSAFDMAQAYSVLANEGTKANLHTIKRIEDHRGEILYEHTIEEEEILSPQTAFLVTDMLTDVVARGTASDLTIIRPLAAKTGTTTDNRDAYLVTYTPDLVVSLWMGHDMQRLGRVDGGSRALMSFMNKILTDTLEDISPSDFSRPEGIEGPVSICGKSGLLPGPYCPEKDIYEELFLSEELPQDSCHLHVKLAVCQKSGDLAGNNCPHWTIEERVFLNRPKYHKTDESWRGEIGRVPEDAWQLPPEGYCQEHTWWNWFIY